MDTTFIDTHTHFFDPNRSIGVPWPSPADEVLYKPTYPKDFESLANRHGVAGTVVVEASQWLEDNQWILDLAATNPVIIGFVGNLDIFDENFGENLDRFAAHPLFRGIRLRADALHTERKDLLNGALKKLEERELVLDLLVRDEDLDAAVDTARSFSQLHVMIDHVAHVRIDGKTPAASWRQGIGACRDYSNTYCKVSGLVEAADRRPAPTEPSFYFPTLDVLVESFGTDRLCYGSNWPVCSKAADYETVFAIPREYFGAKDAVDAVFRKNALSCYRCADPKPKSS
jgi:L-fuconolactonase